MKQMQKHAVTESLSWSNSRSRSRSRFMSGSLSKYAPWCSESWRFRCWWSMSWSRSRSWSMSRSNL